MTDAKTQGDFWGQLRGKMCLMRKEIPHVFIYTLLYFCCYLYIYLFIYLLDLLTYLII
jgi:hypothetical protein